MEGGRWSREEFCVDESVDGIIYDTLPIFSIHPSLGKEVVDREKLYYCPFYKTTDRRGFMTTSGHSTNFIMHLPLPVKDCLTADHFTMRGCAAFCQLDS